MQPNYKRKTLFGKLKPGGKFVFGMGPQYLDEDIRDSKGVGAQNKHHGRKSGSHKHKRDIIKASRRRNRGSVS